MRGALITTNNLTANQERAGNKVRDSSEPPPARDVGVQLSVSSHRGLCSVSTVLPSPPCPAVYCTRRTYKIMSQEVT